MRPWAGVFFDLDGTLADTVELIVHCFHHAWSVHRDSPPPTDLWLATIGRPLREQLADFVDERAEVEAMAETYAAYQKSIHDDHVRPFPQAADVVRTLGRAGSRLAVVTSKRRTMAQRTLDVCGLGDAFELLVCADDVARGKPDPEPVRLALETLGLVDQADGVLFVGDAPYDVLSGKGAGVRTAAVRWSSYPEEVLRETGPDYWLDDLRDLLRLSGEPDAPGSSPV
jgi:pyrophosphatase PpaX